MTDNETLREAFAELERRADLASSSTHADPTARAVATQRSRLLVMAASVAAVLALAGGITYLARGSDSPTRAGGASAPSDAGSDAGSGAVIVEPTPTNATLSPTDSPTTSSSESPSGSPSGSPHAGSPGQIPASPQELANRFGPVLQQVAGDSATFTVTDTGTDPGDPTIVGTMTVGGLTGGFDFQVMRTDMGISAWCDTGSVGCSVRQLPDGSSLAIAHAALQGAANGVTYQANLIQAGGVEVLMHVSNERDPKGESAVLAPEPALSTDQMTAIVTSDRW